MKQGRKALLVFTVLSTLLLSACSEDREKNLVDESSLHEAEPKETTTTNEIVIPDEFMNLPSEMILPPNSLLDLQIAGATYHSADPQLINPDAEGKLHVAADAMTGENTILTVTVADQQKEVEIKIKYALASTIQDVNGIATITNPADLLALVNKERNLPADYVPEGLTPPDIPFYFSENVEKRWLRPVAAKAIEEMFAGAKADGIELVGVSAYRSYKTQEALFARYVSSHGEEAATRFSARAGQSEHQTGLTIDVYNKDLTNGLQESFEDTLEGKWVADNAHKFGFIIRYPKDKESITGYSFEPWHLRYVGTNVAKELYESNLTLEEYFNDNHLYVLN